MFTQFSVDTFFWGTSSVLSYSNLCWMGRKLYREQFIQYRVSLFSTNIVVPFPGQYVHIILITDKKLIFFCLTSSLTCHTEVNTLWEGRWSHVPCVRTPTDVGENFLCVLYPLSPTKMSSLDSTTPCSIPLNEKWQLDNTENL